MALVDRLYDILNILQVHSSISQQELENSLQTSRQTLRKQIQLLNQEMSDIASIVLENRKYKLIIQDYDAFEQIANGALKQGTDFNSTNKRQAYILKQLVESYTPVLIDDLASQVMVSRGTINNDINQLRKVLEVYKLSVIGTPNRGLELQGYELDIRTAYINIVLSYFSCQNLKLTDKQVILKNSPTPQTSIFTKSLLIKAVYTTVLRIKQGHHFEEDIPYYHNFIEKNIEFENFIASLEVHFNLTFSHYEITYLAFPFNIYNRYMINTNDYDQDFLYHLFQQMLRYINQKLGLTIPTHPLFEDLEQHLIYLIHRLIFRIPSRDLFLQEIKQRYPLSFEIAKLSAHILSKELHREIPEIEISYLALYFEMALSKRVAPEKRKIAVVCHTGLGTAEIIKNQLQRILGPSVQLISMTNENISQCDVKEFFAVFSTLPLDQKNYQIPVIQINTLFDEEYIRLQWKNLAKHHPLSNDQLTIILIPLHEVSDYKSCLSIMCQQLYDKGLIAKNFAEKIFQREALSPTIFDNGVAMPHAMNNHKNKTVLAIGQLHPALKTTAHSVELIFMLAIPELEQETTNEVLVQVYEFIFSAANHLNKRHKLLQTTSSKELLHIIQKGKYL